MFTKLFCFAKAHIIKRNKASNRVEKRDEFILKVALDFGVCFLTEVLASTAVVIILQHRNVPTLTVICQLYQFKKKVILQLGMDVHRAPAE